VRLLPNRITEAIAPARLGSNVRWLLASAAVNNIGDGVAIMDGLVIGTPLGGLIARTSGITAPFWFGFIGSAVLVAILWRQFDLIVHAGGSRHAPEPPS
jgi:predicted MFS family arabinose efflux permease